MIKLLICGKTLFAYQITVLYFSTVYLGEMEPRRECCILQPQTQVIVSPKYRVLPSLPQSDAADSVKCEFASSDVGNFETRRDTSNDDDIHKVPEATLSPVNRLIVGFRRFLFGSEMDDGTDKVAESLMYKTEAWNIKAELFCRVLALEDFTVDKLKSKLKLADSTQHADDGCGSNLTLDETLCSSDLSSDSAELLQQPTNVYVSIFTILSQLLAVSLDSVPDTFLATLSCLRSPSEQLAADRIQRAKAARSSSDDMKENDTVVNKRKIVVRVIVMNFNGESRTAGFRFKQPVPQKHILLSSLLRRQMNVCSVSGKVALTPLCISSAMCPAKIKVFPLFSIVSSTALNL